MFNLRFSFSKLNSADLTLPLTPPLTLPLTLLLTLLLRLLLSLLECVSNVSLVVVPLYFHFDLFPKAKIRRYTLFHFYKKHYIKTRRLATTCTFESFLTNIKFTLLLELCPSSTNFGRIDQKQIQNCSSKKCN